MSTETEQGRRVREAVSAFMADWMTQICEYRVQVESLRQEAAKLQQETERRRREDDSEFQSLRKRVEELEARVDWRPKA